jgi:hypothetical protein
MQNVSAAYKQKIHDASRHITAKIEMYFDGDANPPITFSGMQDVIDLTLLEEIKSDNSLLGVITSNELDLLMDNIHNQFTLTNPNSPYYNKIRPNVSVKMWFQLDLGNDILENVYMGKYKLVSCTPDTENMQATFLCYDWLYTILNSNIPMLPVRKNTTLAQMFIDLFTAFGVPEANIVIDASIDVPVVMGWYPKDKVKVALQEMCITGCCSVFASRDEKIIIRDCLKTTASVDTFTGSNQIISLGTPQRQDTIYSAIATQYGYPILMDATQIFIVENIVIPPGVTLLPNLQFSQGPIGKISNIQVINATNVKIVGISAGSWKCSLNLNNTGAAAETVTIKIWGNPILQNIVEYNLPVVGLEDIEEKSLNLNSYLIQSSDAMNNWLVRITKLIHDPQTNIALSVRGNPALELGDCITAQADSLQLAATAVTILSAKYHWDGALDAELVCIKNIALS